MASIEEQVKKIVARKVKLANGKTIQQNLIEAVNYLYECIQHYIELMYEDYEPIKYKRRPRNEGLRSALYVEDFIQARIIGNRIELSLKFNSNVWAWNMNHTHKSPVNMLMDQGWTWHNNAEPVERFTYYEGYHFIEKGIDLFNKNNKWGAKISWDIDVSDWY